MTMKETDVNESNGMVDYGMYKNAKFTLKNVNTGNL